MTALTGTATASLATGAMISNLTSGSGDPWKVMASGAFFGSGTTGLVSQNQSTGAVMLSNYSSGARTNVTTPIIVDPTIWKLLGTGDFNGDGTTDLLWQDQKSSDSQYGLVAIWLMDKAGSGTVKTFVFPGTLPPGTWKFVGVGDFDANGSTDVAWRDENTSDSQNGLVGIWLMNSSGALSGVGFPGTAPSSTWTFLGVGDFNHDGTADLAWQDQNTSDSQNGLVAMWLMSENSPGATSSMTFPGTVPPASYKLLGVGDFDGNGTADLAWRDVNTSDSSYGSVGIWLMNTSGNLSGVTFPGTATPSSWKLLAIGDFNQDHTSDMVWQDQNQTTTDSDHGLVGIWLLSGGNLSQATFPIRSNTSQDQLTIGNVVGDAPPDLMWQDMGAEQVLDWRIQSNATVVQSSVLMQSITVTAATNTKTYNGDRTAAAIPTITAGTLVGSDTANFIETYDTKNVGGSKTLTPSGTVSDGNGGKKYNVTFATSANGVINTRALTVTAAANNKTYDGGTTATVTLLDNRVTGDVLTVTATAAFGDKNVNPVGSPKTVTISGIAISGTDASNYTQNTSATTTANITARPITVTANSNTKIYDGTMSASATPTITAGSLASNDTASWSESYNTKIVGGGKTLTPSGTVYDGNSGNDYSVTLLGNSNGAITARPLTVTAAANNKTYDGGTTATVTLLDNRVTGDVLTVTATAAFGDKNVNPVGSPKTVTVSGIAISGTDATNYTQNTSATTTANITARPITVTAAANTKIYDGTMSASDTPTITAGSLAGNDTASWSESYDNPNAGGGKILTPSGTVNDGDSGNDYSVTFAASASGVITALAPPPRASETCGYYEPSTGAQTSTGTFYLKYSNTTGPADESIVFGDPGVNYIPLAGDWNGDGVTTIGLYEPSNGTFYLKNTNTGGGTNTADITVQYGTVGQGWIPLAGDWNGDGVTTIGVYDPGDSNSQSTFYLKNSDTAGGADISATFGLVITGSTTGWKPIVGDWDGNGTTTIGLYEPSYGQYAICGIFYLSNSNSDPALDIIGNYGSVNLTPLTGDWDHDGTTTIGVFDASQNLLLTNNDTSGVPSYPSFHIAGADSRSIPLVGYWRNQPTVSLSVSNNSVQYGSSVSITATVASNAAGEATPTGTVTFVDGTTTLGTATLSQTVLGTATATLTTTQLAAGSDSIAASYGGDVNYISGTTSVAANEFITTVAGNGSAGYSGDGGQATAAALDDPSGVVLDSSGDLFIGDQQNNRVRKVNLATGVITTVAGDGIAGFSGNGGQATAAELQGPFSLAVDNSGHLFISDMDNNRVREVNLATGVITTVAGGGNTLGDGGQATAAMLDVSAGVAVDASGHLFIADYWDSRIREVNLTTGIIVTVAGNGIAGYSGDGGRATAAALDCPMGVAVDASGNLYIAEQSNRIRKVHLCTGIITTIAGNGVGGNSGDGGQATAAELFNPEAIAVDYAGDIVFADSNNNRIREVNQVTGIITTVAGNGTAGFSGDGGHATAAEIFDPTGLAIDSTGDLYVADRCNMRVREISPLLVRVSPPPPSFTVGPNETVVETALAQSITPWATNITGTAGSLSFIVTNDNSNLFSAEPVINVSNGTLTITAKNTVTGSANVTVELYDSADGEYSAPQTFTLTVSPPPSFTAGHNKTVVENAGLQTNYQWATNINGTLGALSFVVTNDNPHLFSVAPAIDGSGTLTFTPTINATGSATVTVELDDSADKAKSSTQSFTITVSPPPSFTAGSNQSVVENSGPQTVAGWATNITGTAGALSFVIPNDTSDLFSSDDEPAINATTGDLTFTPANNTGSVTLTVELDDSADGAKSSTQSFTITVTPPPVNHAPSGASNTVVTSENVDYIFGTGDFGFSDPNDNPPNNFAAVEITATPNAGSLTDNGAVVTAGQFVPVSDINAAKLVFAPAADASGSDYASFTFQVQDDGGTANGGANLDPNPKTMTITVNEATQASPSVPTNLTTTAATTSEIDLSWTGDPTATSYTVQQGTLGANSVEAYGFAVLDDGQSSGQTVLTITTPQGVAPGGYLMLDFTMADGTAWQTGAIRNTLSNLDSSFGGSPFSSASSSYDGVSVTTITLGGAIQDAYMDDSQIDYGIQWTTLPVSASASLNDTGLSPDAVYYYRVNAANAGGSSDYSSMIQVATLPETPTSLTVTAISSTQVSLSWHDNGNGQDDFNIEQMVDGQWQSIDAVASGSTADTITGQSFEPSTNYSFCVQAYNDATGSCSAPSTVLTVTTGDWPAAPSGLTATIASASEIDLAWTANSGRLKGSGVFVIDSGAGEW
jgi:hypothetical protein